MCERAADKLQACDIREKWFAKGYARVPLDIDREHCSGQIHLRASAEVRALALSMVERLGTTER